MYLHLVAGVCSSVTGLPCTSGHYSNAGGIQAVGRATPCWTGVRRGLDKERYPAPPPKLGAWCEGEILTTSKPQQTGEATAWIWAKRPKRERNNSNKYFLIIYLLAQQPKGQNYSLNTTGWLSKWQPQGQLHRRHKKHRENTQNTSRKRVNKKIHPKITTKTILWNVKEKFVKLKFSYVHRSTHYVQFN